MGDNEIARAEFVRSVIANHQSSELYKTAKIADDYYRGMNTTITQYQKMVTDINGMQHVDKYASVHRCASNFFFVLMSYLNQYLLGNGVTWKTGEGEKLGEDFDNRLQEAGRAALCGGVCYGFWNKDHMEVFPVYSHDNGSFAPMHDEENGALAAGVRYWQIDSAKPLRATLYELDGYTDYLWKTDDKINLDNDWTRLSSDCYARAKKPYVVQEVSTEADGTYIYAGENYPAFPIVPLWSNPNKMSEIINLRELIDAYDMILNGYENDLDNAQLYWIIRGAGGMDDPDLVEFLDKLRLVKAAAPADGQDVTPVTVDIPYEARERLLDRLESRIYQDAMILNPADIQSGADTATQIRAAYEPQNVKADQYEYCILDFLRGIMTVAGISDEATFTRSTVVNVSEEITTVVAAAAYLDEEYVTRKVLALLGDGDQTEEVLKRKDANDAERLSFEDVTDNG